MKLIAFASTKGGVAKTTSAVHFAHWMSKQGESVVLVDSDRNRSALQWLARSEENRRFTPAFKVVSLNRMSKAIEGANWLVFDTSAAIEDADLADLAEDCDLIVVPTKTDIDSLSAAALTTDKLIKSQTAYCILITDAPPKPSKAGEDAQADLKAEGYRVLQQRVRRGEGVRHASLAGATLEQQTGNYRAPWHDYCKAFEQIMKLMEA